MKENLDYTDPDNAVNFRDVGEYINVIAGEQVIPAGKLYRGGTIKYIKDGCPVKNPRTIFCLQKNPDQEIDGIVNVHFPISNDYEKYQTDTPEVRKWLRAVVKTIESGVQYPLYIHCLSGKDRTGVVIACLLKIAGAREEDIIQEYYLSAGTETNDYIHTALAGFRDLDTYFHGIDLNLVRQSLKS